MTADDVRDLLQIVALLAIAYNVAAKLTGMAKSIDHLTEAVTRLVGHPERIAVIETTLVDHERRLTSNGL